MSTTSVRDVVITATEALYQDPGAVDRYFSADYTEHGQYAADGPEGLRAFASGLPEDFRYESLRVLVDGDLVVTHGVYHGFDPIPQVAFDVWRVAGGKVVEHWDAIGPLAEQSASGRSMIDGPQHVGSDERSSDSKALVTEFVQRVLVGQDHSLAVDYISTEEFVQHSLGVADGLDAFLAACAEWAGAGKPLTYSRVHQVVADGDFVFTRSEGAFGGPVSLNDLWRVSDGRIVEHWDVTEPINDEQPHDNGVF